jgi:hypothetical protein
MELETRLRDALAPQDPGPAFAAGVIARIALQPPAVARRATAWRLPASLAASVLVLALGLRWHGEQQRHQRMAFAHQQLVLALSITSAELDSVQKKLTRNDSQESGT